MSERLRAFVRDRVHKDGGAYRWGAAAELANHLQKPSSWVSHYIDTPPLRNADIDTALAICDFFKVSIYDFRDEGVASPVADPPPRLSATVKRILRLVSGMSPAAQRRVAGLVALVASAEMSEQLQRLAAKPTDTRAGAKHTGRGKRRGEE